ncbi:MAG: carbohydrate ABC transporter permease [Chloroflexi bacterium]|uniref:hypothetical protein n=1 Tax=Candidatus Flexifilum breve TaxID=3140694 RepID=UPI00313477A4|nr:carbohydrate ABC transporter permease [Chloroflexota bacterium]
MPALLPPRFNRPIDCRRRSTAGGRTLIYAVLIIGCILTVTPFVWTILASFKTHAEIIDPAQRTFLPREFTFSNYQTIFSDPSLPLARFYANSLFVALSNVVIHTFTKFAVRLRVRQSSNFASSACCSPTSSPR